MYRTLETITNTYMSSSVNYSESIPQRQIQVYSAPLNAFHSNYVENTKYTVQSHSNYTPIDIFLNPFRPATPFIGEIKEIAEHIEECFEKTIGKKLPHTFTIKLCSEQEMKKFHGPGFRDTIQGFSLNRPGSVSEIFIKRDHLDRVMITIGHEIGHILSPPLLNKHNEEAKAFAFELAWLKTIKKHNIAGLSNCINDMQPAQNGLHDLALGWVLDCKRKGKETLSIFRDLIYGKSSIENLL